jgi:hypothetical protein
MFPCSFFRLAKSKNNKYNARNPDLLEPVRKYWIFFIEEALRLKEDNKDE